MPIPIKIENIYDIGYEYKISQQNYVIVPSNYKIAQYKNGTIAKLTVNAGADETTTIYSNSNLTKGATLIFTTDIKITSDSIGTYGYMYIYDMNNNLIASFGPGEYNNDYIIKVANGIVRIDNVKYIKVRCNNDVLSAPQSAIVSGTMYILEPL